MTEDLRKIKKLYGEKMMHLCRGLFPTLLEQEGLLSKLMIDNFAPTKFLYEDIIDSGNAEDFKEYIYSLVDVEKKEEIEVNKTPKQLLEEAGYNLYECKTERDIQNFKKYYKKGEELCTFHRGRLNSCHVFFAVKKNADEIKREDFDKPKRQDAYGTSVISIQFTRGKTNTLSIKNRYNHTVNNPDATYSNNLENIIEGLTESFEREYKLNINQNTSRRFELPGYIKARDGKYYKYNYEIDNIYYCPNNIIIDNFEVKQLESEKYIVLDYFILDLVNKEIKLYDKRITDSFIDGIKDIEKINIAKSKETGNKQIEILTKDKNEIIIELDKTNQIIRYKNNELSKVNNGFMHFNKCLEKLDLPKLVYVGNYFLEWNKALKSLELTNLKKVGDCFLEMNKILTNLSLPNLIKVGDRFLYSNQDLTNLSLPNLVMVEDFFLNNNVKLINLSLPNLIEIGDYFLIWNKGLKNLELINLKKVGDCFLCYNEDLENIYLPNLEEVGGSFLYQNIGLTSISLPKLNNTENYFLHRNINFIEFKSSNLTLLREYFFRGAFKSVHKEVAEKSLYKTTIKVVKKANAFINKLISKIINLRNSIVKKVEQQRGR